MKRFRQLQEERGEKAFKQAIAMGLKYGGFGYWKDPQTGETKFKTENDTLVPVEPDISSEKFQGGGGPGMGQEGGMAAQGMNPDQGMANAAGMLQMPGGQQGTAGQGIGPAPEPGEEQAPKEKGWKPGPDGDTCVGADAEEAAEVPKDAYVGTTNYHRWTAGPDGSNMTTVSKQDLMPEGAISVSQMMMEEYKPYKQQTVYDPRGNKPTDVGFQVEKALAAGILPRIFGEADHRRIPAEESDYAGKTDIESTVNGDKISTGVKSHAGNDLPDNQYNSYTMHSPNNLGGRLGISDEGALRALDLFQDHKFRTYNASPQQRQDLNALMDELNLRKDDIAKLALHGFEGEHIDQFISMSFDEGYSGQKHVNHPDDNDDLQTIMGRVTGHEVDDEKIADAMKDQTWNYDNGRRIYLGDDKVNPLFRIQTPMMRSWGPQDYQIHMGRDKARELMPKMWESQVRFKHGMDKGDKLPHNIEYQDPVIDEENPLVKRLRGQGGDKKIDAEPKKPEYFDSFRDKKSQKPLGPPPGAPAPRIRPPKPEREISGFTDEGYGRKFYDPETKRNRYPIYKSSQPNPVDDQVHHSFETFLGEATGNLDWVVPGDIKPQKDMGFSDDTRGLKRRHKKFMDKMFAKPGLSKTGEKTGKLLQGKNRMGQMGSTTYNSSDWSDGIASGSMTDDDPKYGAGFERVKPPTPPIPGQQKKKEEMTKRMNDEFKKLGMVSQPDLDMDDIYENGKEIGAGIQGRVMLNDDEDTVVKVGNIGAHELEALNRMKDHPNFPTMLNARFNGPFGNVDPVKNNPQGKNPRVGQFYQDHNYGENFYEKFPGAPGMFAMTAAQGEELHNVPWADSDEVQHEITTLVHQLRRDMHKQGIAHNDMHGGNMFYDTETGDMSMLDFGLASVSPIRALMEGLGGINGASVLDIINGRAEEGDEGDYQLDDEFKGWGMLDASYDKTYKMGKMFDDNVDNVRQKLLDESPYDPEDDNAAGYMEAVESFLRGGIRLNKDQVRNHFAAIPHLQRAVGEGSEGEFANGDIEPHDEHIMELMDMLYDGLEDTPMPEKATQQQRMARGHSDMMSPANKKAIGMINKLRSSRGQGKLDVKGYDYEGDGDQERRDRIPPQKRVFDKLIQHDD